MRPLRAVACVGLVFVGLASMPVATAWPIPLVARAGAHSLVAGAGANTLAAAAGQNTLVTVAGPKTQDGGHAPGAGQTSARGGRATVPDGAQDDPGPKRLDPIVLAVAFPSYGTPLADFDAMTRQVIRDLARASAYHGYADPTSSPYLRYQLYDDTVYVDPLAPRPTRYGAADYGELFDRYDVCRRVRDREVDEVWFLVAAGANHGLPGMPEWATTGPGWNTARFPSTSVNMPDCGRPVTTMMYNFVLDTGYALHSFGHRMEGFFMTYRPCDFITASWPWEGNRFGWLGGCGDLDRDRLAFVARPFAGNDHVAACGDVHTPPNVDDMQSYDYNRPGTAKTLCPDWSQDGSADVSEVSCETWGCSQLGYLTWWMQNIPGRDNTNRRADGGLHSNWWNDIFGLDNLPARPTYTPGPPPPTWTPRPWTPPTSTALPSDPTPTFTPEPITTLRPPTLETGEPRLLFEDMFDPDRDERWRDAGGFWTAAFGLLHQPLVRQESLTFVDGLQCGACEAEARVRFDAASYDTTYTREIGLVTRVQDSQNLYLGHLRMARLGHPVDHAPAVSLWRRDDGLWSKLDERPYPLELDRWYGLRLAAVEDWLGLWVDGDLVAQARDQTHTKGGMGLRTVDVEASFDDVRVWDLSGEAPTATPSFTSSPTASASSATRSATPTATATPGSVCFLPWTHTTRREDGH